MPIFEGCLGISMKILSCLFCFFLLLSLSGCKRAQGFTIKKIQSSHPYDSKWDIDTSPPVSDIKEIISQTFFYLGSGNHCYAFVSKDGKYVIKFFKQKHMNTYSLKEYINPFQKSRLQKRAQTRENSFTSYKIAYEELKKETGMIYLHLNKTNHLQKRIAFIDQNGQPFLLNLDEMEFLIQKKAKVGYHYLEKLLTENRFEEAMDGVASLLTLIVKRAKAGISDKDMQFFKNFGFIEGQAIEIDIGEFKRAPFSRNQEAIRCEIEEVAKQIRAWFKFRYPFLLPYLEKKIEEVIETI
jgi:hypothetical protein